jgi:hypothetical protein
VQRAIEKVVLQILLIWIFLVQGVQEVSQIAGLASASPLTPFGVENLVRKPLK